MVNGSDFSPIQPYDTCSTFKAFRPKGSGTEYSKFLESPTIKQLVSDVSERLGYKFPLKVDQVLAMYEMCRYDQAWNLDEPSPWCVVSIIHPPPPNNRIQLANLK